MMSGMMLVRRGAGRIMTLAVVVACLHYMSCSSGDEPTPFDCTKSDLAIALGSKADVSDCAATDGAITVEATGGDTPYQYSINNGAFQSSGVFTGLTAGTHVVKVKDKNNCERTLAPSVVLNSPEGPQIDASDIVADTDCETDDGVITVNASGGTGTLSYSSDGTNFQASNVFDGLRAGDYTITVKDQSNCISVVNESVPSNTGIDYVTDILPIFQAKCQFDGCHPTNGNWFNYSIAKANASQIKTLTANGTMPKEPRGGALTQSELDAIACWVDHGAPEN